MDTTANNEQTITNTELPLTSALESLKLTVGNDSLKAIDPVTAALRRASVPSDSISDGKFVRF